MRPTLNYKIYFFLDFQTFIIHASHAYIIIIKCLLNDIQINIYIKLCIMKIWYGYLVFVEECIKADDRFVSFLCQRLRAVRGEGRGPPVQGDHHPQDDGEAEERGARHHAAQAAGRGLRARRVRGVEGEAVRGAAGGEVPHLHRHAGPGRHGQLRPGLVGELVAGHGADTPHHGVPAPLHSRGGPLPPHHLHLEYLPVLLDAAEVELPELLPRPRVRVRVQLGDGDLASRGDPHQEGLHHAGHQLQLPRPRLAQLVPRPRPVPRHQRVHRPRLPRQGDQAALPRVARPRRGGRGEAEGPRGVEAAGGEAGAGAEVRGAADPGPGAGLRGGQLTPRPALRAPRPVLVSEAAARPAARHLQPLLEDVEQLGLAPAGHGGVEQRGEDEDRSQLVCRCGAGDHGAVVRCYVAWSRGPVSLCPPRPRCSASPAWTPRVSLGQDTAASCWPLLVCGAQPRNCCFLFPLCQVLMENV